MTMSKRPDFLIHETDAEYREKAKEFLTSHQLADFRKCPLLYWQKVQGPVQDEDRPAYLLGRAAHMLILEGRERFDAEYIVGRPINARTGKPYGTNSQAYADWAAAKGKPVLTEEQFALIVNMATGVRSHRLALDLLSDGIAEGVVRADYCGIPCQARLDWLHPQHGIVDLKTCDDLTWFEADARRFGYAHQFAFYHALIMQATGWDAPALDTESCQGPTEPPVPDPGPLPEDLLRIPGFVSEVMDYTFSVSPYPQPVLAFAAALTLQAFLAGRKVRDAADNRTNIYVLALANSGAGKNEPRKVNQRICVEVGLQDCLGDAFASGEGIEDRLFVTPSVLFQTDEIDGLMNAINKASDARHEGIMNVLLKMYTSSSTIHPMRVKAGGQSPGVIDQPSLCLFGTAVPKYYYEALNVRMLNNGFFARLIILEAGRRGRGQTPVSRPVPESILRTARWWADFRPGTGNLRDWHPIPVCVEATPEAEAALEECRAFADDRYAEAEEKDDPAGMAIWARAYEKTRKLALIYAVSDNRLQMRIDERAVRWAWRFVDYQTRRMLFMAASHVAEGEFDARCKRMLEVLTSWRQRRGDAWMPHWELSRRLKWSNKDIEEVRNALISQQRIEYEVGSTMGGGPVTQRYRLLCHDGSMPQLPHANVATGSSGNAVSCEATRSPHDRMWKPAEI